MPQGIAIWRTWWKLDGPHRRTVRPLLRVEGVETLEERRVLSARSVLPVPAEVRPHRSVSKADLAELSGEYTILPKGPGAPTNPLGNLVALDILTTGKRVSAVFFDNPEFKGKPAFKARGEKGKGEGDQIPEVGFEMEGRGKHDDVEVFFDAPTLDTDTGKKKITGSFIIDDEVFSFTALEK